MFDYITPNLNSYINLILDRMIMSLIAKRDDLSKYVYFYLI